MKNLFLSLSLLMFLPLLATAQTPTETYVEGEDYDLISPAVRTVDPDKIEVVEFFWYGCSHCYTFEPVIGAWKKTLGDDVVFRGSPAVWAKPMELHARAYYTAEVLGVLDTMNPLLFQAMNVDGKKLSSEAEIQELFVANGVDVESGGVMAPSLAQTHLAEFTPEVGPIGPAVTARPQLARPRGPVADEQDERDIGVIEDRVNVESTERSKPDSFIVRDQARLGVDEHDRHPAADRLVVQALGHARDRVVRSKKRSRCVQAPSLQPLWHDSCGVPTWTQTVVGSG